jgi:hypothetical protein
MGNCEKFTAKQEHRGIPGLSPGGAVASPARGNAPGALPAAAAVALFSLSIGLGGSPAAANAPIGTRPLHRPARTAAARALARTAAEYGRISLSVDGLGTTASDSIMQIEKPAGATVRKAYLMAVTTGFSLRRLAPGEVLLFDAPVVWSSSVANSIDSWNHWADVTAIVKSRIDAAPPGIIDVAVRETDTYAVDGEALAVIFDDPNQSAERTVFLYFGAQNVDGDRFTIDLAEPISTSLPGLAVRYGLGISFGYIAPDAYPVQYSQIDVNGQRLTTAAGGQDDGENFNGSLITVGGIGDSPSNPVAPDALPTSARSDDELYDLLPFVRDGDASITIDTYNPSDDDNIFFAWLEITGRSVVVVDVDVSLAADPPPGAARSAYEEIFGHFADALYEASNGARKLGRVTIHTGGADAVNAHIVWTPRCHPSAPVSGYGITGLHVNMCDVFADGAGAGADYDFLASAQSRKGAGYTLAHEWGHYYFSLYDEYVGNASYDASPAFPHSADQPVPNSIMNSQWNALSGAYSWLNFSIPKNDTQQTAQFRVYGAPGWPTLARPVAQDPRAGALQALPARIYFPDLAAVAPQSDADAALDLPGDARSALTVTWPASARVRPDAAQIFTVGLASLRGENLPYPEPLVLLAFVSRERLLTNLGVTATITGPGGITTPLRFHDDGVAPDARAADGLYSAIAPYDENGVHRVHIDFDNDAGAGLLVAAAFQPSAGIDGAAVPLDPPQPMTAALRLSKNLDIAVSGVVADDHGDTAAAATTVAADGTPTPGRIDDAADVDVFSFTVPSSGTTFVRVTNLALGASPRLRVLTADGASVLFQTTLAQAAGEYAAIRLAGAAPGAQLYADVADAATAAGGLYEFSVGPQLASDVAAPGGSRVLAPLVAR